MSAPKPTPQRPTMAHEWAGYREQVIGPIAGPVQVEETQKAFYAGAMAAIGILFDTMSPGEHPTPEDEQAVAALIEEVKAFGRSKGANV